MKVAFLVQEFPSISETFIVNQITGLMDLGHEIDIYANYPGRYNKVHSSIQTHDLLKHASFYCLPHSAIWRSLSGIKIIWKYCRCHTKPIIFSLNHVLKKKSNTNFLRILHALVPFLPSKKYEIIHCHFGDNGILGMLLKEIGVLSGALITSLHGADMSIFVKQEGANVYKELFQKGDLFMPVSEYWKQQLLTWGCPCHKILVHHMGVDLEKFKTGNLKLNKKRIELISVCRLVEKKGIEFAIKAIHDIVRSGFKEFKYTVVGDGPLKESLIDLIKKYGLNGKNIDLCGTKNETDIVSLLNKADVFLAPSITSKEGDKEGIPVAIMEAMASGLPVISTKHSGIPELVQDNVSGFLVDQKDWKGLAEKIMIFAGNRDLIYKMGVAGREIIKQSYNSKSLNLRLDKIYKAISAIKLQNINSLS